MSRVALIGENSAEYVDKLLDLWNNGDCAVLLDWRIPFQTAVQMMREAGVSDCFVEKKLLDKSAVDEISDISFIAYEVADISPKLLSDEIRKKYRENYSKDEAVVIYSSGTTGKSKGIILSHFAITTNTDAIIDYMQPNTNDCLYTIRPLSHSSTLAGELLVALRSGCKYLLAPTIVPPRYIFGNISKFDVTILCLNPTMLSMLTDEYSRGKISVIPLKTMYVSGSVLNDDTYSKAHDTFSGVNIYNVYGLSEASPRVTAQRADCCKSNSVGKPIKGVDVVVVDESGNVLSTGNRGIVHVNTPSRYSGYICGEEKHRSLYNGWLNTGDVGYFDDNGELHIINRIDDVIIMNGHKIYPSEVEAQIQKCADIDECVVTSVCFHGEDILCCVYSASSDIRDDIKNKLGSVLMKYEIPKVFIRVDAIPKTRTGKVSSQMAKEIVVRELERTRMYESR